MHGAVARAVETSGGSFFEATVTMLFGMSAFFVINIPAIREFILMIMILLIFSMLGAILVLPAIYSGFINWQAMRAKKGSPTVEPARLGGADGTHEPGS